GSIVNRGLLQVHYNASKAAVIHLSKSLAMEWVAKGIRVNVISPGYTLTPMNLRPEVAEQRKVFERDTPMGRMATPEEMAGPAVTMVKGENGVWVGTTIRAVKPGAWRYTFNVDGVTTVDARNTRTSPNQTQVQSLLVVPGDFSETRDVPHGAVASVRYVATALRNSRREMFVYTPPGYEKSTESYPVLYLIHGGGDTAISWSTVGRANDIVDNLIAE